MLSLVQDTVKHPTGFVPVETPKETTTAGSESVTTLAGLLQKAAKESIGGILTYPPGTINDSSAATTLTYAELFTVAQANAASLHSSLASRGITLASGKIVLIHFESAVDAIPWFWSVILAGAVPAISAPSMLSNNVSERKKHLTHLYKTLDQPLCLTRRALLEPFAVQDAEARIDILSVEELASAPTAAAVPLPSPSVSDLAALMLTSGSSGNSKAVRLTHGQMLAAINGKAQFAQPHASKPYLSWIGMDHVANLTEIHLHALLLGLPQIQISAADLLVDPLQLLNLISRHKVQRTFAPNFYLARLRRALESGVTSSLDADLSLESLEWFGSGGESNVTEVCAALQPLLEKYGARKDVIVPGFGMTETCAGCIYNRQCPSYDKEKRYEFTSLGSCIPGVRMRVTKLISGGQTVEAGPNEIGDLEVSGEVVFKAYHNNPEATARAFTQGGWFRTDDLAFIDDKGFLNLSGRTKEVMIVNGVKYLPVELEAALEEAEIPGTTPTYFCAFSTLDASLDTECVVVIYLPAFDEADDAARFDTQSTIIRIASMHTRSRPRVVPLRKEQLPKSTLGKLSRAKLKAALEKGEFSSQIAANDEAIARHRQTIRGEPDSEAEAIILEEIRFQLALPAEDDFSVNDSILAMGSSSMDLIAVINRLKPRLGLPAPIPLIDILNNPTAKGLAGRIAEVNSEDREYNPVVKLNSFGHKTPLWLIHPGVGEVLVFLNLTKYITDRPVYGMRAKGFNKGEEPFTTIDQVLTCYVEHIKKTQPQGPYALAGYSYGAMLAFEISKRLEALGDEVRYCGSWNLPPHIKYRMRQLDWEECIANLFYFVSLIDQDVALDQCPTIRAMPDRKDAVKHMRKLADPARWDELGLDEDDYLNWADVATKLQGMARDYEPSGSIKCMDVFVAIPLKAVAKDRQDWVENKLSHWKDFVREDVRFHDVEGEHYTMLNPTYVAGFADRLRKVLTERGI